MEDQDNEYISSEIDEKEYRRLLNLFVNSSTEKGIELVKIGEVISTLQRRRCFLDIGAGSGDITIPVSQSFQETTVVEPNRQQADLLKKRCPHFIVHNDQWSMADPGIKKFDFILCSHVLYYIDEKEWPKTIEKMYGNLADGGCIAIILQSPIGETSAFFNKFTKYDIDVLGLWRNIIQRYGNDAAEARYFINEIWTDNIEDMVDIGIFLLIDPKFKTRRAEIMQYFETGHKKGNGYSLLQDEILLVVRKV